MMSQPLLRLHWTLCAVTGLLFAGLWVGGLFDGMERRCQDQTLASGTKPSPRNDILVVAIDSASLNLESLGKPPWRPHVYAKILNRLSQLGARVIAFDVLLEHFYEQRDNEFVAALRNSSAPVVLACQWSQFERPGSVEERWALPASPFRNVVQATTGRRPIMGFINLPVEDGRIRRYWMAKPCPGRDQPVLSFAAAVANIRGTNKLHPAAAQPRQMPASNSDSDNNSSGRIHYAGPAGSFRTINLLELMGDLPHPDLEAWVRGATVIVGSTAPEFHDLHDTPVDELAGDHYQRMPGAEIHANIVNTLAQPNRPRAANLLSALAWLLAWQLGFGSLAVFIRPVFSLAAAVLFVTGISATAQLIYDSSLLMLPVWCPTLAVLVTWGMVVIVRWMTVDRERRRLRNLFGRCLHESVVAELLRGRNRPVVSGELKTVTVFFCDIRGFTSLSERLPPEQVVAMLRDYFEQMCQVIYEHGGAVDKFIGDAIMAFFGTPQGDPQHAQHAVSCAVAMQRTLSKLNDRWLKRGWPAIEVGIGINSGDVVAGMLGSSKKMEYTVIGDPVNVASRLEAKNKELGTTILMSETTAQRLNDSFALKEWGGEIVRGKQDPIRVYSVELPAGIRDAEASTVVTNVPPNLSASPDNPTWSVGPQLQNQ